MPFVKGVSGNKAGRPKGTPDKRSQLRDLIRPHAEKLIQKAVDMALAGDMTAMRLCIDRICPALKPQNELVQVTLCDSDITTMAAEIFRGVTDGQISIDEASALTGLLLTQSRIADIDQGNRDIAFAAHRVRMLQQGQQTLEAERRRETEQRKKKGA